MTDATPERSIPRWAFMIAAAVIASGAYWFSSQALVHQPQHEKLQQLTEEQAALQAQIINHHIGDLTQRLQNIADSNIIRSLIASSNKALLKASENQMYQSLPQMVAYRLIPYGSAELDNSGAVPIRYTELDMIHRAEKGEKVLPEAAFIDGKTFIQLAIAVMVKGEELAAGTLLISIKPDELIKLLLADGHVQLLQQFGQEPGKTLMENAMEGSEYRATATTSNPYWKMHYSMSPLTIERHPVESWRWLATFSITLAFGFIIFFAGLYVAPLLAAKKAKKAAQRQASVQAQKKDLLEIDVEKGDEELLDVSHSMSQPLPSIEEVNLESDESLAKTMPPTANVSLPENIFRDYDIRGLAGNEITDNLAEKIGQAIGSEALDHGETQLIVGRDGRNTSDSYSKKLIQGILNTGCSVVNIGPATTPMMYFACQHFDGINSGVEVTASHNPAEYNGFKVMINGETLFGEAIQKLKQRIQDGNFHQGKGSEQDYDISEAYTLRILEDIILDEYKVVVDAGNGIAGSTAPSLLEELGCEVTPLYCDVDGNFPNHTPDPSIEANLTDLVAKVSETGADLGIALDGDGDRLCLITASGRILWPDEILMLLARDVITRNPGCDILYDVKSSRHLGELISSYGGRPVMWKTGHSHMKTKLKQLNAPLGGEFSGHIFFNERWFGFDDGLYAAARVMEIMTLREQSLDDMATAIPTSVTTPELKIAIDENRKFELVKSLSDKGNFDDAKLTKIDGIRADYPHGWGLIRASNTSPALTLRFEADSPDELKNIQDIFRREIEAVDNQLSLPF